MTKVAKNPAAGGENLPAVVKEKTNHNLLILGAAAIAIAMITTSLSLYIYHESGDIYLDRSRPGFLPDEDEEEEMEAEGNNYKFPDSGAIDNKVIDEYLAQIKTYEKDLDDLPEPYPAHSLSDQALGIPEDRPAEPAPEGEAEEPAEE